MRTFFAALSASKGGKGGRGASVVKEFSRQSLRRNIDDDEEQGRDRGANA
jgi:hypothetical protein